MVDLKKPWTPKSDYAKKKVDETQHIKVAITKMDWLQVRSMATLGGLSAQEYIGKVIREHIHKH